MRRVTIKDIAKEANVSYATVSRALSGSPEISEKTRAHVLEVSKRMGYTKNYIAHAMVKKRTGLIGLIVASVKNPFMSELAFHIEQHAMLKGYNLMLCNSSHDTERERQVFEVLISRQVDGIIIVPTSAETHRHLAPYLETTPTVFVGENLRDAAVSYVAIDNYRGTRIGMEYLYGLGHRDILYFGRRKGSVTHQLRANGYIDACEEAGIEPMICHSSYTSSSIQNGYQLAKTLLTKPIDYTAVFAATDSMALGFMKATSELKIRIPKDLSLMGFDNIQYAELPRIDLTTIEQPQQAIAATAVDTLLERINNPQAGYAHHVLSPKLIERGTCKQLSDTE